MNTNNFYYTKYLKYKNKYLKFKKIGGGTDPCPDEIERQNYSVIDLLVKFNCTYNHIMRLPKAKLDAFTYTEFQDYNSKNVNKITSVYLIFKGFPQEFLRAIGFPESEIPQKISPYKLFSKGIKFIKMKSDYPHLTLLEIKAAGFGVKPELSTKEIMKDIKDAGFTLQEFFEIYKDKIKIFIEAGFTFEELRDSELFTHELLQIYFSPEQFATMSDKEYTKEEILDKIKDDSGKVVPNKLRLINEKRTKKIDPNLIKDIPLEVLFESNYKLEELKNFGFTSSQLISLVKEKKFKYERDYFFELKKVFSLTDLLTDQTSIEDILIIGYKICELKEKGIHSSKFVNIIKENEILFNELACYTLKELVEVGYDERKILLFLNYSLEELISNNYTLDIIKKKFKDDNDIYNKLLKLFSLDEILKYFSIIELSKNYSIIHKKILALRLPSSELLKMGFTLEILYKKFYFKIDELLCLGFRDKFEDLQNVVLSLRENGFNLDYFKSHKFNVNQLKEGGYTAIELKEGGYSAKELINGNYNPLEIKEAGYNISDFTEANFLPVDLLQIGFDYSEIIKIPTNSEFRNYNIYLRRVIDSEINTIRVENIKQIFKIRSNLMTLYCLKNHGIPLKLIIDAKINDRNLDEYEMNKIIDELKYVFTDKDFVKENIPLSYYANKFSHNDLINLQIVTKDLAQIIYPRNWESQKIYIKSMNSSYMSDKKLSVKAVILSNPKLDDLFEMYDLSLIKSTLEFYFNVPYMTPFHPYYKSYKRVNDKILKTMKSS